MAFVDKENIGNVMPKQKASTKLPFAPTKTTNKNSQPKVTAKAPTKKAVTINPAEALKLAKAELRIAELEAERDRLVVNLEAERKAFDVERAAFEEEVARLKKSAIKTTQPSSIPTPILSSDYKDLSAGFDVSRLLEDWERPSSFNTPTSNTASSAQRHDLPRGFSVSRLLMEEF